ncbi:hypothetical protein VKI22_16740 [Cyanobacterium aponinum UTEX 3221]|uniref:Uncharacterized protein n=1 Tax=Cyanobacterium aponinum (strain PCC 10605) TaxID=755178 RepID=K9Z5H2_CYAAP|nr:hypothetical protein [Cyanobacterium aponinum]AFZ53810.1 hypothetical protein Cyan10605_1707 [Cyanobacterium aponinum PCC 10605]MBD2395241.1 hypothetical protein [Cyanobacterium aponinum FACHB-4101]WRL38244.1 hypothetical protein VKI22_16740 [Cyanobacterium aponinum UTEX 3221]
MAKKQSKAFKDLQNLKPIEKKQKIKISRKKSSSLDNFAHDIKENHPDLVMRKVKKGELKMSEVIWNFVAPEMEIVSDLEEGHRLVSVAILAWNLSLLPEQERKDNINNYLVDLGIDNDPLESQAFKKFVQGFIDRKLKYFADIDRVIFDFKLEERRDTFHLSIASQLNED